MHSKDSPFQPAEADSYSVLLAGMATLFIELAFLRYVPGQIRVLGYFTNFVLFAAFLGLGLGILAQRRAPEKQMIAWLGAFSVLALTCLTELGEVLHVFGSPDEFLFLSYQTATSGISLYLFLVIAFVLLASGFVPIGYAVGRTLWGSRPLWRYGLNVAGGLIGIVLFNSLSACAAPPWVWMLIAGVLASFIDLRMPRGWRAAGLVAAVACAALAAASTRGSIWSPYQKLTVAPLHYDSEAGLTQEWYIQSMSPKQRSQLIELPPEFGFTVRVNDDSYQTPLDLRSSAVARYPALYALSRQYDLPYRGLKAGGEVLIIGAGSGNDVAAALRSGAAHVDAVDIDPQILALGRQHPEHPYADPRVEIHQADGRNYLARTNRKYDLIVYGLIDSHVMASQKSNVRLDSYIFTEQAFRLARARLKNDGALIISHAVGTAWCIDRMRRTLAAAWDGKPPIMVSEIVHNPIGNIYLAGDTMKPGRAVDMTINPLNDDWPFVYLKERSIPGQYLLALALVLLISLISVRLVSGPKWQGVEARFFFLGAGFLLLETRALSVLGVLLGTTWAVTSSVFAGVLLMALISTWLVARRGESKSAGSHLGVYVALAALLAINFLVPPSVLLALPAVARVVLGVTLVSLPFLASGILFSLALQATGQADRAIASNLLGALVGGAVEYLSMITGFQALVLVAACFYAAAYCCHFSFFRAAKAP